MMFTTRHTVVAATTLALVLGVAGPAAAHRHAVTTGSGTTVYLANGGNHTPFVKDADSELRRSCGVLAGGMQHNAAYGLETAHHGPDVEPGRGDGCYTIDGSPLDPANDRNPAID